LIFEVFNFDNLLKLICLLYSFFCIFEFLNF